MKYFKNTFPASASYFFSYTRLHVPLYEDILGCFKMRRQLLSLSVIWHIQWECITIYKANRELWYLLHCNLVSSCYNSTIISVLKYFVGFFFLSVCFLNQIIYLGESRISLVQHDIKYVHVFSIINNLK